MLAAIGLLLLVAPLPIGLMAFAAALWRDGYKFMAILTASTAAGATMLFLANALR